MSMKSAHDDETFSALLAICAGNSPVAGEFPSQRTVTRSFDVFFDLRLNKRLSKQSWGWWFETPSCPSWRHCNVHFCLAIKFSSSVWWITTRSSFYWQRLAHGQLHPWYSVESCYSSRPSPPGQNGRHFADDNFGCNCVNEKLCILIKFHWSLSLRVGLTISRCWFR